MFTHTLEIYTGLFITALCIIAKDLNRDALNGPRCLQLKKNDVEEPVHYATISMKNI